MELRHSQFNFQPRHAFALEIPEQLRRKALDAMEGIGGPIDDQE